jgi:uncharacterized protein (TIGR03083 family)
MALDHDAHVRLLAAEVDRIATTVGEADLGAVVPTCPDWTVRDLALHLGTVHRWADTIVATLAEDRVPMSSLDLEPPADHEGPEAWAHWLRMGGEQLVATLSGADPEARVWVWGSDPRVAWWSRRQVHETVVHRIDASLANGDTEWTVEPDTAADGVDEFLGNITSSAYFSSGVANLHGQGSIHLHATDAEGEWMIELSDTGFTITHDHGKGTVAARGGAADLLAATYQRGRRDRLEVFGDTDLLDWWFVNSALE